MKNPKIRTRKDFNKRIESLGLELIKGEGYLYFGSITDELLAESNGGAPSIYIYAFSHGDQAFWEREIADITKWVEETRAYLAEYKQAKPVKLYI